MSDFLSHNEYEGIAAGLDYPAKAFIGGGFVPALSGAVMETVDPATGKKITDIARCDKADVEAAIAAGKAAFESGVWSRLHPSERKAVLLRLADLMEKHLVELSVMEAVDSGKPIQACLTGDIPETIHCLRWQAAYAEAVYGATAPCGENSLGLIEREPCGVVAGVLPWNFPLLMVGWKMAPALAAGNSLILKPAGLTSLTCLKVAELAQKAGVPDGVFNVVTGPGSIIGEAIGLHPDVSVVSFTGSTEVGRLFLQYSAASNLKRVVLELGGKSPFVLLEDFTDIEYAAQQAAVAAFWNMGENCTANSRLIVPRKQKDRFVEALVKELDNWKIGSPLDPETLLGPMISRTHFATVMSYIHKGIEECGAPIIGGKPLDMGAGLYIPPTLFTNVGPADTIAREEIFGPVAAVLTADSDEEALALANNTEYGLQATLLTNDFGKAHRYARALKAGTVSVNAFSEGDNTTPFGGYKMSGFGGKDKGREAFDQYTEIKTVFMNIGR